MQRRPGKEAVERAEIALESLDRAPISTIHAFCSTLLRQFSPALAVDPGFEVQDEVLADRRFEERWRLYLEILSGQPEAIAAVDRVLDLGLWTSDITNLAASLWKQAELAPLLAASPLTCGPAKWPDVGAMLGLLRRLPTASVPSEDKLKRPMEQLASVLQGLERAGDRREAHLAAVLSSLPEGTGNVGQQANWGGKVAVQAARATRQAIVAELRETLAALRSEALAALLPHVVAFVVEDGVRRAVSRASSSSTT